MHFLVMNRFGPKSFESLKICLAVIEFRGGEEYSNAEGDDGDVSENRIGSRVSVEKAQPYPTCTPR